MPLPDDSSMAWPPREWQDVQASIEEADAWYAGDEARLMAYYGGTRSPKQRVGMLSRRTESAGPHRFWGRQTQAGDRVRVHVPIAADVASTSADLVFGEELGLLIPEAHELAPDAEPGTDTSTRVVDAVAAATEARLTEIIEDDGWLNKLLEAGEFAAGLGTAWLRLVWDRELADHPMLTVVPGDQAVPEMKLGRPTAVTFWQVVGEDGQTVWRHLERHEPGVILHGLYAGSKNTLGARKNLTDHPATADLQPALDLVQLGIPDGDKTMLSRMMPNVRPWSRHRRWAIGRPDTAGAEGLMDAMDEAMSSWVRDIRLGKARIVTPDEFLDKARGSAAVFDLDREVFTPLGMDPGSREKLTIELIQPEIRTESHMKTVLEIAERIVVHAGYSPATFGLIGDSGVVQTATEVVARTGKTNRTVSRKQRYAGPAVRDIGELALVVDRHILGHTATEPMRPELRWPENESDPMRIAETIALLVQSRAASIETAVKMAQPDLDQPAVLEEVEQIRQDHALGVDDPTGGLPAPGGAPSPGSGSDDDEPDDP